MNPRIGAKIKRARLAKSLRLLELARQIECSESLLSKIENDRVMPSVVLLQRLTRALDINVSWLLNEEGDDQKVIIRKGERRIVDFTKLKSMEGTIIERIAPYVEGTLLQMMLFVIEPGGHTVGTLSHQGEDFGYVLEGEIDILVDGASHHLEAGDAFQFASERPHGYHNRGTEITRILWVNTPPTF